MKFYGRFVAIGMSTDAVGFGGNVFLDCDGNVG